MSDRMNCHILGRILGTASGWDTLDTNAIIFYDFIPAPELIAVLPTHDCLEVNFETGQLSIYSEDGNPIASWDMISALTNSRQVPS